MLVNVVVGTATGLMCLNALTTMVHMLFELDDFGVVGRRCVWIVVCNHLLLILETIRLHMLPVRIPRACVHVAQLKSEEN
jgi:hypothetical protein